MGGVVTFDPAVFKGLYPEFATVTDGTLTGYFNRACLYLNNTVCSPVADLGIRSTLLDLVTAHIAAMSGSGVNGQGAPGMVGRLDQVGEGTVNAHTSYSTTVPGSMAWYIQTTYGAQYWEATAAYRTFRYRPGPPAAPASPAYSLPGLYPYIPPR